MMLTDFPPYERPSESSILRALSRSLDFLPAELLSMASTLSVAIGATLDELRTVYAQVWPMANRDLERVLDALVSLPFVEHANGRVRVAEPLGAELARDLHDSDPGHFNLAFAAFGRTEAARLAADAAEPFAAWQAKSRLAYYLLGSDEDSATDSFVRAFDDAPFETRASCRRWLSSLTGRYTAISGEVSRIGRFFEAFDHYVDEDHSGARPLLLALCDERQEDGIEAIALHLLALGTVDPASVARRTELLESSVGLSAALGLDENLIMARNTLVWTAIGKARRERLFKVDHAVAEMAAKNDQLAELHGNPFYCTVTKYTRAMSNWYSEVGLGTAKEVDFALVNDCIALLDSSIEEAVEAHDLRSRVVSAIGKSSVYRSASMINQAVESLRDGVAAVEAARAVPPIPIAPFEGEVHRVAVLVSDTSRQAEIENIGSAMRRALRRRL